MKRYDLRNLGDDFYDRMVELTQNDLSIDEVGIFLFEVGDFSSIQKSADTVRATGHELMNSLKFNEVDWTIVVKRLSQSDADANAKAYADKLEQAAKAEAEKESTKEAEAK